MRMEICPGCLSQQPVDYKGHFHVHGCNTDTKTYCSWAGRRAVDFRSKRNFAKEALTQLYPDGLPKKPRKRNRRRKPVQGD